MSLSPSVKAYLSSSVSLFCDPSPSQTPTPGTGSEQEVGSVSSQFCFGSAKGWILITEQNSMTMKTTITGTTIYFILNPNNITKPTTYFILNPNNTFKSLTDYKMEATRGK